MFYWCDELSSFNIKLIPLTSLLSTISHLQWLPIFYIVEFWLLSGSPTHETPCVYKSSKTVQNMDNSLEIFVAVIYKGKRSLLKKLQTYTNYPCFTKWNGLVKTSQWRICLYTKNGKDLSTNWYDIAPNSRKWPIRPLVSVSSDYFNKFIRKVLNIFFTKKSTIKYHFLQDFFNNFIRKVLNLFLTMKFHININGTLLSVSSEQQRYKNHLLHKSLSSLH